MFCRCFACSVPTPNSIFDVAAQMIDAVCGDLCSARCLGEDEGALDDGLCVQRESSAAPAPFRVESIRAIEHSSISGPWAPIHRGKG
jgi:hypothetical protein